MKSFGEKCVKRDHDFYKRKKNDYEEIEIPNNFNKDEKIENKVTEKIEEKNLKKSNISESNVKDFVVDFQNKYKHEDIYKVLELDNIIKGFNEYMAGKNSLVLNNSSINQNNQNDFNQKKFSLKASNINESFIPKIEVDDNKNAYSSKNNTIQNDSKNYDINININNNNTKVKDSSIFLLEKNYDNKNANEDNKKSIQQSVILGHAITNPNA